MKRNIVLIGSMGSGKSHIGRNLAEALGWQFVDTDRMLEEHYGQPIAEVYKKIGEKSFRQNEQRIVKRVNRYHEAIISIGGNFPMEPRTVKWLQRYSYVIALKADEQRLVKRVKRRIGKRPTMDYNDLEGFVETMIRSWKPIYKRCDFVLDTTFEDSLALVDIVLKELKKKQISFKKRRKERSYDKHKEYRTLN